MNKLEIICYIISAFFMGMSAGCFISIGIHNSVYGDKIKPLKPRGFRAWLSRIRRKRKPLVIDEMHEHRDDNIQEALKLGMSQKTRQVKSYYAQVEGFLTLDHDTGEMRPTRQSDLRAQCVHQLADNLIKSGAVCFTFAKEDGPTVMHLPRLRCAAKLDVVMPDKEEAET